MQRLVDSLLVAALFVVVAACGGSGNDSGGPSGSGASAAHDGGVGDVVVIDTGFGGSNAEGGWDGPTCAAQGYSAEVYPLDMLLMMDQSGSMVNTIDAAQTITKWQAVTTGLGTFLQTQSTTGADLGVGIQFFPLPVAALNTLPACPQGNECGADSYCVHTGDQRVCLKSCLVTADCGGPECVPAGGNIHVCANDSCEPADYGAPEVAVGPLAQTKDAVLNAMKAHVPIMWTPTGPALSGAIQYAKAYAPQHTDRRIIVVLATDGLPTECPADQTADQLIEQVKQAAKNGVDGDASIRTFVVGVVHPDDATYQTSVANLNAIAVQGGTNEALIVHPQQDLATQFADALGKIKGEALVCEYKIPLSDGGKPDFGAVNVEYALNAGATQTVYHVADASKCDGALGGWYYDPDPNNGDPTSIILCPQTCTLLQKPGQKVDFNFKLGCATTEMPK